MMTKHFEALKILDADEKDSVLYMAGEIYRDTVVQMISETKVKPGDDSYVALLEKTTDLAIEAALHWNEVQNLVKP